MRDIKDLPEQVILDTETTGLSPETSRIVEIGLLFFNDTAKETFQTYFKIPAGEFNLGAMSVNGIHHNTVKDAPQFQEVADHLAKLLKGKKVYAFNAKFDTAFLEKEFSRAGRPAPEYGAVVCVQQIASKKLGRRVSLRKAADWLGVTPGKAHTAIGDCETTLEVLKKLEEKN